MLDIHVYWCLSSYVGHSCVLVFE